MTEINFGRQLKIAANHMVKRFDDFARQYGLTSNDLAVIDYIQHSPRQAVSQAQIEREFAIQRSTASILLKRMETKGLIRRQKMVSDGRQKLVVLTDKAADLTAEISTYMSKEESALRAAFSPSELAIFERILTFYRQTEE